MATIKEGYNSEITEIKICSSDNHNLMAEVWIDQRDRTSTMRSETLAYATLEELIQLRDEINNALKEIIGV